MTHDNDPARGCDEEQKDDTPERLSQLPIEMPKINPSNEDTRFEHAQSRAGRNAERAGASTARELFGGVLHGVGRRAGEELWDLLTGSGA